MAKRPEGGVIKFNYENRYYKVRIENSIYVDDKKALMLEIVEQYRTKKLEEIVTSKPQILTISREEQFPCINEKMGPVNMEAEYINDLLNVEIEISQENGQCWIHETAMKTLENMLCIPLEKQENKIKGSQVYRTLTMEDENGNVILGDKVKVRLGRTDPHPPGYYQLFLTIMDVWEYARRQVKPAI